jgi:hypothetical protein
MHDVMGANAPAMWFTFPATPNGIVGEGTGNDCYAIMEDAVRRGIKIRGVNMMTMYFGSHYMPPGSLDMAAPCISASEGLKKQLQAIYLKSAGIHLSDSSAYEMVGICPMIGRSNIDGNPEQEVFRIQDAEKVLSYAFEKGVGQLTYWALTRDRSGATFDLPNGTGMNTGDYAYAHVFDRYNGGWTPTPPPVLPPVVPPVIPPVPPSLHPPSNLRETGRTTNSISLSWNPSYTANISGYRIYRNNVIIGNILPNVSSYTDTGLLPGTSYSYAVASYDNYGGEATSNTITASTEVQAVIPPQPPTPPQGQGFSYRVIGEGSNRQTIVITNRSSSNISSGWRLHFNFNGTSPNIEWPANWALPGANSFDTTVNGALNAGGSVSIPMGAGANTRIYDLAVNGMLANRE